MRERSSGPVVVVKAVNRRVQIEHNQAGTRDSNLPDRNIGLHAMFHGLEGKNSLSEVTLLACCSFL